MGTMTRSSLTDDDGSGTTGSIWNNAELQKIYDNVDNEVKSATNANVQTKTVIDIVAAATQGGTAGTLVGGTLSVGLYANTSIICRHRDVVRT